MTRDEAVSRAQMILAFRGDKSQDLINALQDAQLQLEKKATLPWFLLSEMAFISLTVNEERVLLPSDFLRETEQSALYLHDASSSAVNTEDEYITLAKEDLDFLRRTLPGAGTPSAYALDDSYFRLFPTPNQAAVDQFKLRQIYYKKGALLTTNIENVWLEHFPWLLIGIGGAMVAAGLRDRDAIGIFAAFEAKEYAIMVDDTEARKHAQRRYIMGGPD